MLFFREHPAAHAYWKLSSTTTVWSNGHWVALVEKSGVKCFALGVKCLAEELPADQIQHNRCYVTMELYKEIWIKITISVLFCSSICRGYIVCHSVTHKLQFNICYKTTCVQLHFLFVLNEFTSQSYAFWIFNEAETCQKKVSFDIGFIAFSNRSQSLWGKL